MKSPISRSATISGMKVNSRSPLMRWGIVLGLTAIYLLVFPTLVSMFGPSATTLIAIPVAAATWYFGLSGGLIFGLLLVSINILFLITFEQFDLSKLIYFGLFPKLLILTLFIATTHFLRKWRNRHIQIEDDLLERERFSSLLNDISHSIITSDDLNLMMETLGIDLAHLFRADYVHILNWDSGKNQFTPLDNSEDSPKPDLNLAFSVLQTSKIITSNPVNENSAIGIPLIVGENKLGAVLIGYQSTHESTLEEIKRAEQAGKQIAIALLNAQKDTELKKRLHESKTLADISRALSETEKIGLSNVLQLIVTSAQELLVKAEQVVIHLLDENEQMLIPGAISGNNVSAEGKRKMRLGEGVAGLAISSGETINIEDVETDPRFVKLNNAPSFRSLMVTPVQSGQKKLGTLSIQSNLSHAFTKEDGELLGALGTQAAIAIENAHLLENIQQTLKEVNSLYRVNQGLVASLETDKLLQDTVELLQKNFGYYHVQIYLVDSENGDIFLSEGSGEIGKKLKETGHHLRAGDSVVGYVAETGEPYFTNDVDLVHFFVRNPLLPETKSELAVPVKISGLILGVLDIQQIPPIYLTQRDIQLVSSVADQLAVALQKANLYEELQISLQQEKAIRNQMIQNERLAVMGRLLASVSHELNNPLQAIQNALFLLREEKGISPQGRQDLDIVLAESERMANMISQLRATYRPIQTEDFRLTQLNNIVEDVHTLIATHLRHNEVTFEFHQNPELPPILALSDQIRQVVLNLFMNAVEAMSNGGKLIISTNLSEDTSEVLLTISDTGTGISPTILPNIFDAFVTDKQTGTGLGLTITYDIVIKHRGRITAQNNEDHGSTFKVWLPIKSKEIA